jgi:hypothetical protein
MTFSKGRLRTALAMVAAVGMTASIVSGQKNTDTQGSASSNAPERTIEGVWRTVVTPRNCQTGDPLGPAVIRGLFTFHEGGTMSEFGVAPGSTPALRSPGHGVWQREHGWQDYSFSFIHNRYDAGGAFIGYQTVRATLELDASGDAFTTQSTIQVFDATDNLVGTFCATAAGTRFE